MDYDLILKGVIAIAPVLILLMVFDRLDAFNLIPLRDIARLTALGGAIAALTFLANWRIMDGFPIGFSAYSRYVAPAIEETLKAAPIVWLFAVNRLGYKLDAAIAGFALGAGFSVVENGWYLFTITDANISDWLVRGFGTAVMHSAATALFAIISHEMTEKQAEGRASEYRFKPLLFLPGLGAAMAVHSTFNHFPGQPLAIMVITLLLAPATIFLTLARSERANRHWLAADREAHRRMLEEIRSGRFAETEEGRAIKAVAASVRSDRAEEAFAYAQLKLELVLRAEELLLASQEGGAVEIGFEDREKFARLQDLRTRLGPTVVALVNAQLGVSRNDLYEFDRLRARVAAEA